MVILFRDGFESGDFSAWTGSTTTGTGTVAVESANPYRGIYNMKSASTGGIFKACVYKSGLTSTAIAYYRAYYKFGVTLAYGEVIYLGGLGYVGWDDSAYAMVQNSWADGKLHWGLDVVIGGSEVATLETTASQPTTGIWYCVEIMRDVTNGRTKLWVDGVLKMDISSAHSGNNNFMVHGVSYSDSAANQAVYSDCVVVADARIGCERRFLPLTRNMNPRYQSRTLQYM